MNLLIKNCRFIAPDTDMPGASLLVSNGTVAQVIPAGCPRPPADCIYDAAGNMLMPGFFDIHTHGRDDADFCDGTLEAIRTLSAGKLKEGTTSLLSTTLTQSREVLESVAAATAEYVKSGSPFGRFPGIHLEGPYINLKMIGGQNPAFVRPPDIEEVKRINSVFPVKKVSYAPEIAGADVFTEQLLDMGINPSAAHSAASCQEFMTCYRLGLRCLTHFCNQMSPLHHRDIGLVGAGLLMKDISLELICDKIHVSPEMIKLVFQTKDIDHVMLITDSLRCSGLKDGVYDSGGMPYEVKNGIARLVSNGHLAGSSLNMNIALKNVYELTGLPLKELVKTTSWNQAKSMGLTGIGKLAVGDPADFVILDPEFRVLRTYVGGDCRFEAES